MEIQKLVSGLWVTVISISLPCVVAHAASQEKDSRAAPEKERRFSVVHAHFGNNCAGYLYVSQEFVRYKALVPENYQNHSFELKRSEITALGPWVLMGQPQNLAEIKTAHAAYHFWLLRKGTDLNTARSSNLNTVAAPVEELIAALRDPERALERAAAKVAAQDAEAESPTERNLNADALTRNKATAKRPGPPAGEGSAADSDVSSETEATDKVPRGVLEGIYLGFRLDGSHMGSHEYYFTRDGWVINNIPLVNMDHFDMTAYRNNPSNKLFIGRYRVDGDLVHIVWANNADRRDVIKYDEAAENPGINTYIPTCRCTGKRFSGKYHWSSPTDARYIQFFPDGTFFDHGLTDQVVDVPNPHGYRGITDPPRNFRGTYSIRNQRLTFNFDDGKQATVAFIAPKALERAPAFEWFGLGHGTGVPDAETVIVLMLYEEHYQVQP